MLSETLSLSSAAPSGAPSTLADLWRRRLDTIITGIANRDPYYLQIANAAEHVSADYHGRILIELLQNANDQAVREGLANTLVTIHRTKQLLAVGNSGQPFDNAKVDAITSLFKTTSRQTSALATRALDSRRSSRLLTRRKSIVLLPVGTWEQGVRSPSAWSANRLKMNCSQLRSARSPLNFSTAKSIVE